MFLLETGIHGEIAVEFTIGQVPARMFKADRFGGMVPAAGKVSKVSWDGDAQS